MILRKMERKPQFSTVCSEIVLAGSCFWAYNRLCEITEIDYQFGKWWFMMEMIAAILGAAKFGEFMKKYSVQIEKYHRNFSWMTLTVGIPCLGAQFCVLNGFTSLSQIFLGMAVVAFFTGIRRPHLKTQVSLILPAVVLFIVLALFGLKESNFNLCSAIVLLIVATAMGTEGKMPMLEMPRVDIFHYLLVVVNYFIMRALLPS